MLAPQAHAQRSLDAIRTVYQERQSDAYDAAADDFLARLADGGDEIAWAQLAVVIPDSVGRSEVVAWWRSQDPLPATDRNERLVEYLARVAVAQRAFPDDGPVGFDVRGETFVRYGRPATRRSIEVESDLFISRAIRSEPTVRRSDFPSNVVWYYPDLGPNVYFVFVERRGEYRLGSVMDLVPRTLLAGGLTRVTEPRARLLGQVLRWIYKDLYSFSAEFRDRLVDIDAVVDSEGRAFSGRTGLILQSEVQKARQSDDLDQLNRDEMLPPSRTQVVPSGFGVVPSVAVFRDAPQDSISVWVGWGLDPSRVTAAVDSLAALGLAPDRYLIDVAGVGYDADYRVDARTDRQSSLTLPLSRTEPEWFVVPGGTETTETAIQWTLTPATADGTPVAPGAVSAHVRRLAAPGQNLATMSGLLAVDANQAMGMGEVDRLSAFPAPRMPGVVQPGDPVAVYVEIYGDPGDRFEIETRAVWARDGRFLRAGTERGAASASEIELYDWRYPFLAFTNTSGIDGADRLMIEVTVTDLSTGEETVRSMTFETR